MNVLTKWIVRVACATAATLSLVPVAHAGFFASDDDTFIALRAASMKGDIAKSDDLASRLPNYVIPSYVDYYRLRPRINTASEQEVRDFLTRYEGSAIADRLRNDWLLELGKQRNWALFDEQYPLFVLDDDTQVKCYALMSKALKGQDVADDARAVLVAPQNYGEGCTALISTLVQNNQFSADDLWLQIRMMSDAGNLAALHRVDELTGISDTVFSRVLDKPQKTVAHGAGRGRDAHELFMLALGRVARSNLPQAVNALLASANLLNEKERAIAWAQVAYPASLQLAPEAVAYWRLTSKASLSPEASQWKVRAALRGGDWPLVKEAIEAMPASLRKDSTWVYWLGRAYKAEGKNDEARIQFQSIASQTNFYGQLAQEELGQKIMIPPRASAATAEEIAPMAQNVGFQRALKFFDLNLRFEGYREWNWELRKMDERQHLAAAEFARQKNVLDRMISTSDRTKTQFDFTQRFPSPHRDVMTTNTQRLGLDMAWVYGLIRQESRFIQTARSQVGASGLMQIMPATARWVAKKIGLDGFTTDQIHDIDTNILLGTNYLSMVLNKLDGSQALATAAYNAGPGRPKAWIATLSQPVEGAVFAESIPFNETRDYVKKVLSNATYYAALFDGKPQSLKARLGIISPQGYSAPLGDLP